MTTHRLPTVCPVCSGDLITTRLGCPDCGTELVGQFDRCAYGALDDADHELLRVFLVSRGNLRELEKHLGVSYPTARSRFDAVLSKLGFVSNQDAEMGSASAAASEAATDPRGSAATAEAAEDDPDSPASPEVGTMRDQVLAQVASGALAPEMAADLLRRLT
ncbi:MAG: DUF2089 domain-containing protein [Propioniciclava sp.]